MRYAIFSDVHANRQAWEAVLADALQQQADTLVCLGDVVGYGPKPQEVLTAVREVTPNFVLGNHDAAACGRLDPSIFNERARIVIEWTREQLDEDSLQFLEQVPLQMDGSDIQFVHAEVMEPGEFGYVDGIGPAELNLQAMTKVIGFLGHTHLPLAFTMPRRGGRVQQLPPLDFDLERGRRYLVNVGSVGEPRTTDVRASYVIYDDVERRVYFRKVVFDVEAYKADLAETGLDIRPYFVQVVDAGKVAGTAVPTAAPQMALAQSPRVAEVVAGHHGHLVLGTQSGGWAGGAVATTVAQPKSVSGWMLGSLVALVLVVVIGAIVAISRKGDDPLAGANAGGARAGEVDPAKGKRDKKAVRASQASRDVARPALPVVQEPEGPVQRLVVRRFGTSFANLAELREADRNEEYDHNEKVADGFPNLAHAGTEEACGLVWEGFLVAPETGEHEFVLEAGTGAALLLDDIVVLEVAGSQEGGTRRATYAFKNTRRTPFRLEYFHEGAGVKKLSLRWTGPGIEKEVSLVGTGESRTSPRVVRDTDRNPRPAPAVEREAPAELSQDLLTYWSFDRRQGPSRFERQPDGSVWENLIMETSQVVEVLVPRQDLGKKWTSHKFGAEGWQKGTNGVGYERTPGDYKDLLATTIVSEAGKYPTSVYVRIPFEVEDPADYAGLALYMKYDDAFYCYLNGKPGFAASETAPNPEDLRWNSAAAAKYDDKKAVEPSLFKVSSKRSWLRKGQNVLAVHAMNHPGTPNDTNTGSNSSDMLIQARLVGLRKDAELPPGSEPPKPSPHDRVVEAAALQGKVKPGQTEGKFGEAYRFEEGSIEIGAKNDYALGDQPLTVSLWFTRDPATTDKQARRLLSAGAGGGKKAGWALWVMQEAAGLSFVVSDGDSKSTISGKRESLANGDWHHVAVTVDRENQEILVFLDGEMLADRRVTLLGNNTIASVSGLSIGRNSDDEQHHRGLLDDVAIWRRALLPTEVTRIYERGSDGKGLGAVFDEKK